MGATSTKSISNCSASHMASSSFFTPICAPSGATKRTTAALIASFTRSSAIVFSSCSSGFQPAKESAPKKPQRTNNRWPGGKQISLRFVIASNQVYLTTVNLPKVHLISDRRASTTARAACEPALDPCLLRATACSHSETASTELPTGTPVSTCNWISPWTAPSTTDWK